MRDIYACGGNLWKAERTVKNGGVIKFDGTVFSSAWLIPNVGERVECKFIGNSPFSTGPIEVNDMHGFFLCTLYYQPEIK